MPNFTLACSSSDFLTVVSPAVAVLLSAIAAWVASRARTTSQDALSTLWSQPALDRRSSTSHGGSASRSVARDRRK